MESENILYDAFLRHMAASGKIIKINGESAIAFFIEYGERTASDDYKYIFTNHGLLAQGDEIEALDGYWLNIKDNININSAYDKSLIRQAKHKIKFIFCDGEIGEFISIVDTKALDTETNQYILLPSGKILITMQENYLTEQIEIQQRLIVMDNAYQVVGIDKSKIGLITLTCEMDQFTNNDNIKLGIADYYRYVIEEPEPEPIEQTYVTMTPDNTTMMLGKTIEFVGHYVNNGVEDITKFFNFIVTNEDGTNNRYVDCEIYNTSVIITALNNSASMGKIINVRVELLGMPLIYCDRKIKLVAF